jgi:hypothetical protein
LQQQKELFTQLSELEEQRKRRAKEQVVVVCIVASDVCIMVGAVHCGERCVCCAGAGEAQQRDGVCSARATTAAAAPIARGQLSIHGAALS